jgi:hypothetical protein
MARPIEATPILKGKDAQAFLKKTHLDQPVPTSRVDWLNKLAQQSKRAEK